MSVLQQVKLTDEQPVIDVSQFSAEQKKMAEILAQRGFCRIAAGPEKNCPSCGVLMLQSIMVCADCGHKF